MSWSRERPAWPSARRQDRMRTTTSFTALDHIPEPLRIFIGRRFAELAGCVILMGLVALGLALATWSIQDPSLNHATSAPVHNLLRAPGAIVSDFVMQMFGLASLAMMMPLAFWGWRLVTERRLPRIRMRLALLFVGSLCAAGVAALLPVSAHWPLPTGLGGVLGDIVMAIPRRLLGGYKPVLLVATGVIAITAVLLLSASVGLRERTSLEDEEDLAMAPRSPRRSREESDETDADGEPGLVLLTLGALFHAGLSLRGAFARRLRQWQPRRSMPDDGLSLAGRDRDFDVPFDLAFANEPPSAGLEQPRFDAHAYAPPALRAKRDQEQAADGSVRREPDRRDLDQDQVARVIPAAPAPVQSQRALREVQRQDRPDT